MSKNYQTQTAPMCTVKPQKLRTIIVSNNVTVTFCKCKKLKLPHYIL